MNIAEITTYEEGGVYTHVMELVKRLKANTIIISGNTKRSGYQKENGRSFFHIPCIFSPWTIYFINSPGSYRKVKALLKKHKIELVHFHNPLFTFSNGLIMKPELPLIMTAHYVLDLKGSRLVSTIYKIVIRIVTCYISKKVDKIICVNNDYIPIFTSWGIDREKLVFIPNGIDLEKFSPGKSKIKEKYKHNKLIVFFGRLHYQKNVDLLIRSFELIKDKSAKLIIIGDGPDANRLRKLSADDNNIILTGRVSDDELLDYLRAAYMMVLPSRGETASLTMMEAMACELPVIASDVGNASEMLADGRGILLKEYTEREIAEKCNYLLQHPKASKEMGKKALNFVRKYYSLENTCNKTEALYRTVIKQRRETLHNGESNHLNK